MFAAVMAAKVLFSRQQFFIPTPTNAKDKIATAMRAFLLSINVSTVAESGIFSTVYTSYHNY